MTATNILVHLLGEIALLLWAVHMVNSGVLRAFGSDLRWILAKGLKSRPQSVFAGIAVTALLQSSTATALMITSFSAVGAVGLTTALAVMLGANVGTALVVQVVSFNISIVFPILIFGGYLLFRRGRTTRLRGSGRALIGLGLLLLSLQLISETIQPVEASATLKAVLAAVSADPLILTIFTAIFAWASHSSVAAMLFIIPLASAGIVDPQSTVAMVLGANVGSALNPLLEGMGGSLARLRVPVGNFAIRAVGCIVALPFLDQIVRAMHVIDPSTVRFAANVHTLFNVALALVFVFPLPWLASILERLLPDTTKVSDPGVPLYLDVNALDMPSVALTNAAREALRIVDVVGKMLSDCQYLLRHDDVERLEAVGKLDDVIDELYSSIHKYLLAISQESLCEEDSNRLSEILMFAINLEHVGDIIDKSLMELAKKRIKNRLRLPENLLSETDAMYAQIRDHLQLAATIVMFHDKDAARKLVLEKEQFRDLERVVTHRHVTQIRERKASLVEASVLQLDIVRDLKRIEAHIAATAHPLLESGGDLKPSRLS